MWYTSVVHTSLMWQHVATACVEPAYSLNARIAHAEVMRFASATLGSKPLQHSARPQWEVAHPQAQGVFCSQSGVAFVFSFRQVCVTQSAPR